MSRVWMITGASSGFGRSLAQAVLARGETVVAAGRRADALDDLAREHGERLHAVALDVTDAGACEAVVADVVATHGRIDVLVNNAP